MRHKYTNTIKYVSNDMRTVVDTGERDYDDHIQAEVWRSWRMEPN